MASCAYVVIARRHELGVRLELRASAGHVVRSITTNLFGMMFLGAIIGLAGGLACGGLVNRLLFEVKPTDPGIVLGPVLLLVSTAVLGAVQPSRLTGYATQGDSARLQPP